MKPLLISMASIVSTLMDMVMVGNQEQKNLVKFFYLSNQMIIELLIYWGFKGLALRGEYYHILNFLYYLFSFLYEFIS